MDPPLLGDEGQHRLHEQTSNEITSSSNADPGYVEGSDVQTQGVDKGPRSGDGATFLGPSDVHQPHSSFSSFFIQYLEKNQGFPTLKPAYMDAAGEDNMMCLSWLLTVGIKIIS